MHSGTHGSNLSLTLNSFQCNVAGFGAEISGSYSEIINKIG